MKKFKFLSIILLSCMAASTISAQGDEPSLVEKPFFPKGIHFTSPQYADLLNSNATCFNTSSQAIKNEMIRVSNAYNISAWGFNPLSWDNMDYILYHAKKVKPDGRKLSNEYVNSDGSFGIKSYVSDKNDSVWEYNGRYIYKDDCGNILIDENGIAGSAPAAISGSGGTEPQGNGAQSDIAKKNSDGITINGNNNTINVGTSQGTNSTGYSQPQTPYLSYPQTYYTGGIYSYGLYGSYGYGGGYYSGYGCNNYYGNGSCGNNNYGNYQTPSCQSGNNPTITYTGTVNPTYYGPRNPGQ